MQTAEGMMLRHLLIDLRVILHGARPQRIETGVDAEVVVAHIGVMPNHSGFIHLGQFGSLRTDKMIRKFRSGRTAVVGHYGSTSSLTRKLKNQFAVIFSVHNLLGCRRLYQFNQSVHLLSRALLGHRYK